MANAVVTYVVNKLGDFLIQQAEFLQGIEGELQWLQREMRLLRSYLKDAEQKQGSDERIRTWISEIQDIAYDTEDTIEVFIFKVNNEQINTSTLGRMSSSVKNRFCCICNNAKLYDIGKDIEALKKRVLDISRQRETYGINNIDITQNNGSGGGGGGLRTTTSYRDEYLDVVGFEDDVESLQKQLFYGVQGLSVLSILGMGGLGKTTLARKLYNDNKIKFTLCAWICVSQDWKTEDLLEKLIKSFVELTREEREKVDKMKLFELEPYLRNLLEKRQYLVVIDDLWHREAWESIKNAFPDNNNGSRIIITTRKEDVATLSDDGTHVHRLRFLRGDESWSLFCKKAFPNKNGVCPDNFKTLGKEMTAKCGGLPLAIVVLGGLLSKKEFHEWEDVKEHIWREVKEGSMRDISLLLDLSYNDLSIHLKPCFLYLCIFPEDALIRVTKLVKLWVAEELIPIDEEGRTLEEVSECYFKELIGRNLVQTVERNWRMTSICRVHDLLRDLALKKARETNFFRVYDQIGSSSSSLPTTSCRRFVVHSGLAIEELLNHLNKKVRTLYLLNDKSSIHYSENEKRNVSIVWRFRLLRVLELEGIDLHGERKLGFVEGVGEMIHLRYLGLKNTKVDELPNSIGNLKVLQTLNIKSSVVVTPITLPKDICKLKELRHLAGQFCKVGFSQLAGLSNLQTLKVMLQTRTNMETDTFSNFFATLNNLRTLRMDFLGNDSISIEPLFNCKELIELKITGGGKVREVPKDIHKHLTKLKYLELFLSESEEDPIPKLEMLPSLLALHLSYDINKTISWTFTANGFSQLEFLNLEFASNMKLLIEEGAMPRLKFLCLEDDELKQTLFPERFWSLPGEEAMNWTFSKSSVFLKASGYKRSNNTQVYK